jgi:hypothetical protein
LRDSLRSLTDGFKSDHATLREEMRRREERVRKEADEMGKKYRALLEETRAAEEARAEVRRAGKEKEENAGRIREAWKEEIDAMKEEVARSSKESEEAVQLAKYAFFFLLKGRKVLTTLVVRYRSNSRAYVDSCKLPDEKRATLA